MGDQRQHDRKEDQGRGTGVQKPEIDEAEDTGQGRPKQVDPLAPETVREMSKQRDRHEGEDRSGQYGRQHKVARHLERPDRVGEYERRKDVERRLFRHPGKCTEKNFLGMLAQYRQNRRAVQSLRLLQP